MRLRSSSRPTPMRAGRPVRVLIEDPALADVPDEALPPWVDLVVCTGPRGRQACPLVADATCPAGEVDVVVDALPDAWADPVARAWHGCGVVAVDGRGFDAPDPAARLRHHLGLALGSAFRPALDGPPTRMR